MNKFFKGKTVSQVINDLNVLLAVNAEKLSKLNSTELNDMKRSNKNHLENLLAGETTFVTPDYSGRWLLPFNTNGDGMLVEVGPYGRRMLLVKMRFKNVGGYGRYGKERVLYSFDPIEVYEGENYGEYNGYKALKDMPVEGVDAWVVEQAKEVAEVKKKIAAEKEAQYEAFLKEKGLTHEDVRVLHGLYHAIGRY